MQQKMKVRFIYNEPLFVELPRLLGITNRHVGESIGKSRMWYQQALDRQDAMLKHLVALCNVWHIDIMSFIIPAEDYDNPDLNFRRSETPVEYHPGNIRLLWRDRFQPIVMRKQLQEDGGWNKLTVRAFMNEENSTLCICDWIFMCNQYNLDPKLIFKP